MFGRAAITLSIGPHSIVYICFICLCLHIICINIASQSSVFASRRSARIAIAVLAIAIPSVRLSVRLPHAGIVSKRLHVARCSLHYQIAKCVCFCRNRKIFPRDNPFPLKSWFRLTYPFLIAASLDTFCLVAPQP